MKKKGYEFQDRAALKEAKRMSRKGYHENEIIYWLLKMYDGMTKSKAEKLAKKSFYENPVRIPEKVLAWRERQRKGSIMRPSTFKAITRTALQGGYAVPEAVGGKAYWITVLNKYLDMHPGDKTALKTLRKLLETRGKRRGYGPGDIGLIAPTSSYYKAYPGEGRNPRRRKLKYRSTEDIQDAWLKRRRGKKRERPWKDYSHLDPWSSSGAPPRRKRNPLDFYTKRRERVKEFARGSRARAVTKGKRKDEKWYIGYYLWKKGYPEFEVFLSSIKPTRKTHGHLFRKIIGPFNRRPTFREWVQTPPYKKLPRMR